MRDIGYSLPTAVADVIDNSVTAGARRIEILADTDADVPAIGIIDDGCGMAESELLEAMRLGTTSPLAERSNTDLGRFGLGLKTASFSQCRRLTVVTRKNDMMSSAVWDLDTVAETEEWYVELPADYTTIPWFNQLGASGTLVVWQKLDRFGDQNSADRKELIEQIDRAASHVELVFHRFLSAEHGRKSIRIFLNGRELEPFDPFHSRHPATQPGQEEVFSLDGRKIRIQAVTLPHHNKVTATEWERYGGTEGYLRNQGFYLYRNRRLIIHGTWFGLAKQSELTKLARVRIDMPNSLDTRWRIDVKKASAQPPIPVKRRLQKIIERIGAPSRKAYVSRGTRLSTDNRLPVWVKMQKDNQIHYRLNAEHPVFAGFTQKLSPAMADEFTVLVNLINAALPVEATYADAGANPESVGAYPLAADQFAESVKSTWLALVEGGVSREEARLMMRSAEPFRSNWESARRIIEDLGEPEVTSG